MKKLAINIAVCTLLGTSFASHASLTSSADGKTIYDSDLNLTWLATRTTPRHLVTVATVS